MKILKIAAFVVCLIPLQANALLIDGFTTGPDLVIPHGGGADSLSYSGKDDHNIDRHISLNRASGSSSVEFHSNGMKGSGSELDSGVKTVPSILFTYTGLKGRNAEVNRFVLNNFDADHSGRVSMRLTYTDGQSRTVVNRVKPGVSDLSFNFHNAAPVSSVALQIFGSAAFDASWGALKAIPYCPPSPVSEPAAVALLVPMAWLLRKRFTI